MEKYFQIFRVEDWKNLKEGIKLLEESYATLKDSGLKNAIKDNLLLLAKSHFAVSEEEGQNSDYKLSLDYSIKSLELVEDSNLKDKALIKAYCRYISKTCRRFGN